jgi:hypothetical protein
MNIKDKIKKTLRTEYGDFKTHLEHIYEDKVTDILIDGDIKNKKAWLTYNQVILELKHSIKDNLKVKELQYKLTDNLDPNEVCIEVMEDVKHRSPELERLYYKIINFI